MTTLGQYFTKNIILKEQLYNFILNKPKNILEPSIGRGDLIDYIQSKNIDLNFDMYEIDKTIKFLDCINVDNIHFGDFIKKKISKKYTTIIGNPPYVRTKSGNLYIDFTKKCYNLLDDKGELIFIVPSDFLKLTSSSSLLNTMMENGTFTHIFHPHNENLFENASIDVIIFRYCKNKILEKTTLYNDKKMTINNSDGLITFRTYDINEVSNIHLIKDYFDIYVGIVSGKEEVFKNNKLGNIEVLNGLDKLEKYIFIDKFPCENEEINNHMLKHKKELIGRKIRKFNDNNWFEWGALRNISVVNKHTGSDCIYISNLTRKDNVAFLGKISYFGGSLLMLKPKIKYDLDFMNRTVLYLNSDNFKSNFLYSGRFKIGHRQLSNSYLEADINVSFQF